MSTTSSLAGDFAKLTVPQLKALCKERRIVGYSKLGKAALLQKLTDNNVHNPQPVIPTQANVSTSEITVPVEHTGHPASSLAPALSIGVTSFLDHTHDTQTAHKDSTPNTSAKLSPQLKTLPVSCLVGPSVATVHHSSTTVVAASSPDVQAPDENHGTKRPRVSAIFKSAKRQKPSSVNAASVWDADSSTSTTQPSTSAGTLKLHTGLVSVTESAAGRLPRNSSVSSNAVPIVAQLRDAQLVQKESTTKRQGRFKPLVFTSIPIVASTPVISQQATALNDHLADETTCIPSDTFGFEAAPLSTPSFVNITFPPKLSDRKRVQRWAIILAALSDQDRQICVLVSRAFRYAVYLSAAHILTQKYHGHRLNQIMKRYPQNMTNMWPYLRQRQNEVAFWRQTFQNSFVGRYNSSPWNDPLSACLWASPDDEKQVVIALRFVLTRFWFTLSIGTNGRDPSAWLKDTVEDAQEVVKGEIWAITIRDGNSLSEFYVLESTCEVIGRAFNTPQLEVYSSGLRADWSEYISSYTGASVEPRNLISEHLRWANYEEYDRGISRHWLRRISSEGDVGLAKKVVAERYVMACVVANSISGRWMSSNQMAQEFAGLPSQSTLITTRGRTPKINFYLPAHHHVESVHFTTPKGVPLHPALAVMQTPAREYIILKDNGMQVGCEEDGVAEVWMQVLGCDNNGIVVACSK